MAKAIEADYKRWNARRAIEPSIVWHNIIRKKMPVDNSIQRFVPGLRDMVEGRIEPRLWFEWLEENSAALKETMPPGWYLRLKPKFLGQSINRAASVAVDGISYVLNAMDVPHDKTDRFARAYEAEFEEFCKREEAKRRARQKELKPVLDRIKQHFPKFAALIKRRIDSYPSIAPPATQDELAVVEQALNAKIPATLRHLFEISARILLDPLDINTNLFDHPIASELAGTTMICFGEYSLKADGDQVLFRLDEFSEDHPHVYYYAHEVPSVEPTKKRFTAWLESLSRSPVFRD